MKVIWRSRRLARFFATIAILISAVGPLRADDTLVALDRKVTSLLGQNKLSEAILVAEEALVVAERLHQTDASLLFRLSTLGFIYSFDKHRAADAERLYERMLKIFEKGAGEEDEATLRSYASILDLLARQREQRGLLADAASLRERGLVIQEKLQVIRDKTSDGMAENASRYIKSGQLDQAETLLKRALLLDEIEYAKPPLFPDFMSRRVIELANFYHKLGRSAEAAPLYNRAIKFFERELAELEKPEKLNKSQMPSLLNGLAGLYQKIDETAKADVLFERALIVLENTPQPNYQQIAFSLFKLSERNRVLNREGDGAALYERWAKAVNNAGCQVKISTTGPVSSLVLKPTHGVSRDKFGCP